MPDVKRALIKTRTTRVYKRMPHETYMATWTDLDGRRRTKTCATYEEACEAKRKAEEAKRAGERTTVTRETVTEYVDRWINGYMGRTIRGVSDLTLEEYRIDLETRIKPALGRRRLAALTREDVRRFVRALRDEGLAARTVRRILAPLRAALADAVDAGLIGQNPAAGVKVPAPRKADEEDAHTERALTDAQVARIIDSAPERYRLLIRVIALTGLRGSEALALHWRDVADGCVKVRRRLRAGDVGPPKSRAGRRDVPIPQALADDLALARATALHPDDGDFVFATASGRPLGEDNASHRAMKPAAVAAGVPWAAFHDLRRAAITRWIRNGMSPKVVQRIAGHHDAAFTLQVYARVRDGDLPAGDALGLHLG